MLRFIEKPNLPENPVKLIAIGKDYSKRLSFSYFGIDTIYLDAYEGLEGAVRFHADMQVLHLYSTEFAVIPDIRCKVNLLYSEYLQNMDANANSLIMELKTGERRNFEKYPHSASYNALIIGRYAIFNSQCIDPSIMNYLRDKYICLDVNQGYARCSTCIVNEDAAITSDPSIYKALSDIGIDVLKIVPGYISLPGYRYGFIGGASFKISRDVVAFTGSLDEHPDKYRILDYLKIHGVEAVFLSSEPIFDIGSAILILESS